MDADRQRRLFFFIDRIAEHRIAYETLKRDEDERKTTNYLGLMAIKYDVICFILTAIVAGLLIGAIVLFGNGGTGIWIGILLIIVAIACLPYMLIYFVLALNCSIKQMVLNKRAVGWVSLLFTLLIPVLMVVAVVVTILIISA